MIVLELRLRSHASRFALIEFIPATFQLHKMILAIAKPSFLLLVHLLSEFLLRFSSSPHLSCKRVLKLLILFNLTNGIQNHLTLVFLKFLRLQFRPQNLQLLFRIPFQPVFIPFITIWPPFSP